MGFSRQEYWSGLPFPSPGDLPDQGSNPGLMHCRQTLYTVKVTNRFKGLDLIDRVPEELWMEVHDIVQEAVIKTIPKKKKCKKAKWLTEQALQIAEKRREVKSNGEKERYYPSECRIPKNSKER